MEELFYIADRGSVDAATSLIRMFGEAAVVEAAARADHYRGVGNATRFCEWRQIERMVSILNQDMAFGTVH